ncbi:MAG: hypothetical protein M1826_001258 [Phylliscum demangeonii]|nr:MAG: hypothetical protein M1826_001258 [Phylliscum demangeonii]
MDAVEAKIVVLGSQGVGKTSLVLRYTTDTYAPSSTLSTIGASFLTKRVIDDETNTTVRLQIWDTAGQERFRSMSKLYYRGANAGILCYDVTDASSFHEMTRWLHELREHLAADVVMHVVGTKLDLVQKDPSLRKVPFETVLAFVEEHLVTSFPSRLSTQDINRHSDPSSRWNGRGWAQHVACEMCHEVSARDGEGVDELFRLVSRKLVQQSRHHLKEANYGAATAARESIGARPGAQGRGLDGTGSFRVGRDRRSWIRSNYTSEEFGDFTDPEETIGHLLPSLAWQAHGGEDMSLLGL